jgi:magnesium transporter
MRVFAIYGEQFSELPELPDALPAQGFLWISSARREFGEQAPAVQAGLQRWQVGTLVDLHTADLLNPQLPSHYDYTSWYDVLIFRRLAAGAGSANLFVDESNGTAATAREVLNAIDTSPVGFAVFDRVLVTVHPADCAVRDFFASRMASLTQSALASGAVVHSNPTPVTVPGSSEGRGVARLPTSPADLMLRMVNHMVDSYLDLRRLLTRQLGYLQHQLLDPKSRFDDWPLLLEWRNALNQLEEICEDQRSAVQEWIDALAEWPAEGDADKRRERELLSVRSRDVLEHVERVLSHVRRLEQSAETAVQMHFSALGHRTNDIMRTLTVLTAIFLPLNLITGFFGMNFDGLPLVHTSTGIWITLGLMVSVAAVLVYVFRSKRYLGRGRR